METISDNPIKDLGEGIGKGVTDSIIDKSSSGIKFLINKFKEGKLAFIQERSTIDKARELLKSNEHHFYCTYIDDKEKQVLAVLGLTLRRLDEESNIKGRENLVIKIKKKYGFQSAHISYLVQNGVLSRYLTNLLERIEDIKLLKETLNNFMKEVDKFVYFVRSGQNSIQVADSVKTKIFAGSPKFFIISGTGSTMTIVSESFNLIKNDISSEYELLEKSSNNKREIIFLEKKEYLGN